MKQFKFKYSNLVYVLLFVTLALSLAGVVWNIFNVLSFVKIGNTLKAVSSSIIAVLALILAVVVLSVVFYGRYVIKDGYLYTYFGFFKNKTPVNEITGITHFKKSNKLVVYFCTDEFSVIVIAPEKYDDFILALREANKSIVYDAKIDGEETPE